MRATPELSLHFAVAEMLERFAAPGVVWWHTNNTTSSARYGAKLKRMGVRAGVADFIILPGRFHWYAPPRCCFLELKSAKGRASESQIAFRAAVEHLGCMYEIARTPEEAQEFLIDIGAIHKIIPSDSRLSIRKRDHAA